jgi:hypothetical protein
MISTFTNTTCDLLDIPVEVNIEIIFHAILKALKEIPEFEVDYPEADDNEAGYDAIIFSYGRFSYKIYIEDAETIQFQLDYIKDVPMQEKFWNYRNETMSYSGILEKLIKIKQEKPHQEIIDLYDGMMELKQKYGDYLFDDFIRFCNDI